MMVRDSIRELSSPSYFPSFSLSLPSLLFVLAAMMKSTAYFINTSRGPNIDEAALTVALQEGALAGAALDVWDPEPPLPDNPLLKMDNVLATQHTSGPTFQAHEAMSKSAADQWATIFRGEKPPRLANPEAWPNYIERYTRIIGEPPQEN